MENNIVILAYFCEHSSFLLFTKLSLIKLGVIELGVIELGVIELGVPKSKI